MWLAGRRWTVEESFQSSKGLTGLDQHQVRTWTSWHRWTILVMLAHAFLAVTTAAQRTRETPDSTLIRLSINEFRRLFIALVLTPRHGIDCTASTTFSTGRTGADDTNNEPDYVTKTAGQNLSRLDLRL